MASVYQLFTWKGKPINDIHEWAREHGEMMVQYRATRPAPTPWDHHFKEVQIGEMPESFWNTLAWTGGWSYVELGRRPA